MDDIPLPSSDDSPGPPGEENVKRERKHARRCQPDSSSCSSSKPKTHIETYSPSMVTSSPDYSPREEMKDTYHRDAKDLSAAEKENPQKMVDGDDNMYKRELRASPPISQVQTSTSSTTKKYRDLSNIKSQRLAKQRLKAFAASNKAAVSFGIHKMNKLNKSGNIPTFGDPEEDESREVPTKASASGQKISASNDKFNQRPDERSKQNFSPSYTDNDKNRKSSSRRNKDSSKMNIDTIMEEESIQKAIYEKTYLPHKVQMIEIPNKPKKMHNMSMDLTVGNDSENIDDLERWPEYESGRPAVDQMGFVVNPKAAKLSMLRQDTYENVSTKSRDRQRSRRSRSRSKGGEGSRSADEKEHRTRKIPDHSSTRTSPLSTSKIRNIFMPANIKHVPTSWNDCKENGVEICQIRELKNIYKHKESPAEPTLEDSLMMMVDRADGKSLVSHYSNSQTQDSYSIECEKAMKFVFRGAIDSVDEISKKEFPKRCIKRTKTEPEIQWSFNPQQDLSAYLMSREDILSEASREELPYLEAIIHGLQKDTSIEDDNIFGGRNDWYPKASLCLKSAEEDSARKLKSRSTSKHNLPKLHEDNMYCKNERIDINDEIDRTQWIKRASSGDFMQNYKDDPSPRVEDDLLSSLLGTKKKKKKKSKQTDDEGHLPVKHSKKKKKDKKKKKKTKKDIDIFGDSELPWADPEKLVQLDEVVSMGSHMNRSDSKRLNYKHSKADPKAIKTSDIDDATNEKNYNRSHDQDTWKAGSSMDIEKDRQNKRTRDCLKESPSPPCRQKTIEIRERASKFPKTSNADLHSMEMSKEGLYARAGIAENKLLNDRTPVRPGPRTPPTPNQQNNERKRTGPRTPSPQDPQGSVKIRRSTKKETDCFPSELRSRNISPDCGNTNWKPPSPLYDSTLPAERSLSYRSPIQSSRETEHDIKNESQNSPSSKIRTNEKNPFLDPNIRRDISVSSSRERVEKLYDQYEKRKDMSKSPRSYEYQGPTPPENDFHMRRGASYYSRDDRRFDYHSRSSRSPESRLKSCHQEPDRGVFSRHSPREHSPSQSYRNYRIARSPSPVRRVPHHEYRRGRYRNGSPSSPIRYSRRSPERRRSPVFSRPRSRERRTSASPPRRGYGSPYYKGRRTPSPRHHRRAFESPSRDNNPADNLRYSSNYLTSAQPQPDSTIADSELGHTIYNQHRFKRHYEVGEFSSHVGANSNDFDYHSIRSVTADSCIEKSSHYISNIPSVGMIDHDFSMAGTAFMNSPKRLSLDERLEKELGIKVKQDCNNPDYSRPPPGYLPSGERLHGTVNLTSTSTSANSEININVSKNPRDLNSDPCMISVSSGSKQHQTFQVLETDQHLAPNNEKSITIAPTKLGIVPQYPLNSESKHETGASNASSDAYLPTNMSFVDAPEEGRLVRVGNMLQIVPESEKPDESTLSTFGQPTLTPSSSRLPIQVSSQMAEEVRTKELLQKVEEMGRKKDEERRKRRELRMAERMNQAQPESDLNIGICKLDDGNEITCEKPGHDDASTSDRAQYGNRDNNDLVQKSNLHHAPMAQDGNATSETHHEKDENSKSAKTVSPALDPQSFNTRSMSELNLLMSTASQKPHEEHIVDGDLYGRGKKRPKHGTEVRYISLKPLDKREKKRQEKIQAMRRMVKNAVSNVGMLDSEGVVENDDSNANSEAEEFMPRSPVPLPDVSSCRPILVQLGFSLSKKGKKVLRYADGVLPGQGSPDHTDEGSTIGTSVNSSKTTPEMSGTFQLKKSRKRKKIRVTIIEQISPSDNDDGEIPPPPPGSPPLFSIKEFLARYPSSKSALPIPIVTGAN